MKPAHLVEYDKDFARQVGSGIHTFTDEHKRKNRELMNRLMDVLPFADNNKTNDCDLIYRYLVGRKWDIKEAEKSIREYLQWRKRERIDSVMWEVLDPQVNEAVASFYGLDMEGYPVMWDTPNPKTFAKLLKNLPRDQLVRAHFKLMESARYLSRTNGVDRISYVLDLTQVTMTSVNSDSLGLLKEMSHLDQLYYPEVMRRMLICNGGWVVNAAWKVIRPALDERVQQKIQFLKDAPSLKTLKEYVANNQIPQRYGGVGNGTCGTSQSSLEEQLAIAISSSAPGTFASRLSSLTAPPSSASAAAGTTTTVATATSATDPSQVDLDPQRGVSPLHNTLERLNSRPKISYDEAKKLSAPTTLVSSDEDVDSVPPPAPPSTTMMVHHHTRNFSDDDRFYSLSDNDDDEQEGNNGAAALQSTTSPKQQRTPCVPVVTVRSSPITKSPPAALPLQKPNGAKQRSSSPSTTRLTASQQREATRSQASADDLNGAMVVAPNNNNAAVLAPTIPSSSLSLSSQSLGASQSLLCRQTSDSEVLTPGRLGDGTAVVIQLQRFGRILRGYHRNRLLGETQENLIVTYPHDAHVNPNAPGTTVRDTSFSGASSDDSSDTGAKVASIQPWGRSSHSSSQASGGTTSPPQHRILLGELLREAGHPLHTHILVTDAHRRATFVLMKRNLHKQIVIYQVVGDTKVHTNKSGKHSVHGEKAKMARCGERAGTTSKANRDDWAVWGKVRVGNQDVRKYLAERQGNAVFFYDTMAQLPVHDLFCLAAGIAELWEA